jgi:hypothetical protein
MEKDYKDLNSVWKNENKFIWFCFQAIRWLFIACCVALLFYTCVMTGA